MSILERILEVKKKEVHQLKNHQVPFQRPLKEKVRFSQRVQEDTHMSCIAEIKRASPSKGILNEHVDPVKQAIIYEENGAQAISVLTDDTFFGGSFSDLQAVSEAVSIPVLCKDFIIDEVQIDCAIEHGASLILLIVAALSNEELLHLYSYATNRKIEVLCEVHNIEEYERAKEIGCKIIGINNRDLHTFHVDITTTKQIADLDAGNTPILVSESGIQQASDVQFVQQAGASAILVGEALMCSTDIPGMFAELRIKHSLPSREV
ncbi:MAG TPA: indole-3-glycerol phosphate synthase TrpC [Bacillota bacterium]|nr:indole-3-glycerol phosphate synthase TrpC [Bacillota bacterium]